VSEATYAWLDFETGGFDEKADGLVSVAVIRLDQDLNEIDRSYLELYEEDKNYSPSAMKVNGYTVEYLKEHGLRPDVFIPMLHDLIDGCIMGNHNSAFDCKWLNARGWNIQESCDTMVMSLGLYPYAKAKLGIAASREGIEVKDAHNALGDTAMTVELFKKYVAKNPKYLQPNPIVWDRFKRW
jgi:DNA polymerase III alpha subunit (gram-positive type)